MILRLIKPFPLALLFLLAAPVPVLAETSKPEPLRVGDVRIFGNKKIQSYILRREIPFEKGDFFDSEELKRTRRRIRKIPGVDYSEVRVAYTPVDSSIVLSVLITERSTFNGRPLFRRGYQNKMSFGLQLWERNFRGRSENLTGFFLLRGNTVVDASWENPWVGSGPRFGAGANLFYRKYNYVYDDFGPALADAPIERFGAEGTLFRKLGEDIRISLSGGFESVRSSTPGVTIEPEEDTYATVSMSAMYDSRRSPLFPWNGMLLKVVAKEIGPGSDIFTIHEGTVDLRLFKSLRGRGILAGHGRLRYREGDLIPLYRRDHIGGSQTLRGYEYGSYHGARSIITGVEGRLPINFSMDLRPEHILFGWVWHIFADAAAAWDQNKDLSMRNFHGGFGVGCLLLTKSASGLRFDYAWRLDGPGRFEFDIGTKF